MFDVRFVVGSLYWSVVDFDKFLCGNCAWERFPFFDGFYR